MLRSLCVRLVVEMIAIIAMRALQQIAVFILAMVLGLAATSAVGERFSQLRARFRSAGQIRGCPLRTRFDAPCLKGGLALIEGFSTGRMRHAELKLLTESAELRAGLFTETAFLRLAGLLTVSARWIADHNSSAMVESGSSVNSASRALRATSIRALVCCALMSGSSLGLFGMGVRLTV